MCLICAQKRERGVVVLHCRRESLVVLSVLLNTRTLPQLGFSTKFLRHPKPYQTKKSFPLGQLAGEWEKKVKSSDIQIHVIIVKPPLVSFYLKVLF